MEICYSKYFITGGKQTSGTVGRAGCAVQGRTRPWPQLPAPADRGTPTPRYRQREGGERFPKALPGAPFNTWRRPTGFLGAALRANSLRGKEATPQLSAAPKAASDATASRLAHCSLQQQLSWWLPQPSELGSCRRYRVAESRRRQK